MELRAIIQLQKGKTKKEKEGDSTRNDSGRTNIIPVADVGTPEARRARKRRPARRRAKAETSQNQKSRRRTGGQRIAERKRNQSQASEVRR